MVWPRWQMRAVNVAMRFGLSLLSVVVCCAAMADIVPLGFRRPGVGSERIRIENVAELPGYTFYLWPRDLDRGTPGNTVVPVGADGIAPVTGFNPLAVGDVGGTGGIHLIAVPRAVWAAWDVDPERVLAKGTGVLKVGTGIVPRHAIPAWEGRRVVTWVFEVRGLPDRLEVIPMGTEVVYGSWAVSRGTAGMVLVGLACAGAAGLAARRWRTSWGAPP